MNAPLLLSIFALVTSVLGLGVAAFSLIARQTHPEVAAVQREVHALSADLSDLADRWNHWMRRDATRSARLAREAQSTPTPEAGALPPGARKALLRQRAGLAAVQSPGG